MKTKFTCILTAFAVAGVASVATAGPDLQTMQLRQQIAASQSNSGVADRGSVKYVANPSGKGGTVTPTDRPTTSIALFKSKKAANCDAQCCAAR
jgi:hypothetical protein